MDLQKTRTWAEISLSAIEHNCRAIRSAVGSESTFLGVVKADGYGHGAVAVAAALRRAGAGYLAVACPSEALELRKSGESLPILILGAADAACAPAMAEADITMTAESREKAQALSEALAPGQRLKIHLKLDTGMGRLGFPAASDTCVDEAVAVLALDNLDAEGIFTHFAVSDEPDTGTDYTREQFALFRRRVAEIQTRSGKTFRLCHCANSGGVLHHRDGGVCLDMIRPGLLTYGVYPEESRGGLELRPAMAVRCRISAVTHHKKGDTISYGRTWTAERDCTLAVLPMGYADGLHRSLSGQLDVLIHGRRARQVGRICMDMCMVDITDLPGVRAGDVATVLGADGAGCITANELAAKADTIPYEILCAISPRVPRIYVEDRA